MKKFFALVLSVAMVMCFSVSAFAAEVQDTDAIADNTSLENEVPYSEPGMVEGSYVRIWENPTPEDGTEEFQNPNARYGERYVSTIEKSSKDHVNTVPQGQPRYGYCMPSGGSVYIRTSKGYSVNATLSVGWAVKGVPISVNVGMASEDSGVGGMAVSIPANNHHYVVHLRHNYTINHVRVDYYQYNEYKSTSYVDKPILDSIDAWVVATD